MDERDELQQVVAQVLEYARFYREMGVTDIADIGALPPVVVSSTITPELTRPEPVASGDLRQQDSAAEPAARPAPRESLPMPGKSTSKAPAPPPNLPGQTSVAYMTKVPTPPPLLPLPVVSSPTAGLQTQSEATTETLEDIRRDLGDCRRCKLWSTRTNIVFGEGNPTATLMLVGEAPGADEDQAGRPFIGRAGQLLTRMIESIELSRDEIYIANVLKSRPPDNRNPERDEMLACRPFLLRQIAVVRPKLIVTLGNPATQALLDTKVGITRMRGIFHDYPYVAGIRVLPTFHPAYLLRSPDKKREAWEDLKKVRDFLKQL